MSCPFCTLPEIQARKVAENELAFAFLTNIPITVGHTLVSPKRCVARFEDLTPAEASAVEQLRRRVVSGLVKSFGAKAFNFAWNDGKLAGQSVPHFHLHIVPRKEGDSGVLKYEPREFLYRPGSRESSPEKELLKVAEIIRTSING